MALGIGAFVLPASLVIAATGVMWKWLGWAGIVIGLANIVGALTVLEGEDIGPLSVIGFAGFIGFGLWTILAGVGLLRSAGKSDA